MSCVNIRGCCIGRCAIIYYNTLYCAAEEGFVYDTHR